MRRFFYARDKDRSIQRRPDCGLAGSGVLDHKFAAAMRKAKPFIEVFDAGDLCGATPAADGVADRKCLQPNQAMKYLQNLGAAPQQTGADPLATEVWIDLDGFYIQQAITLSGF